MVESNYVRRITRNQAINTVEIMARNQAKSTQKCIKELGKNSRQKKQAFCRGNMQEIGRLQAAMYEIV